MSMNSLEFIKQHVTEWPSDTIEQVMLCTSGTVVFADSKSPTPRRTVDLSEHFAPDYYDGKVWTREEFEACGESTVEYRFNDNCANPLIKSEFSDYYYYLVDSGVWQKYDDMPPRHWDSAVKISDNMVNNYIKQGVITLNESSIDATVEERGNRYGTFEDGADIMQELKSVMRSTPNWSKLNRPSRARAISQ